MADVPVPPPAPVAIRITRPYATEEEYLDEELETLTRTSITLLGAQPRPQGIVLRFELVLASGQVLARGEGRVVGFKPNAHEGLGGLTLRFTRLDSRTKALVDRAATLREHRKPSTRPPLGDVGAQSLPSGELSSATSLPPTDLSSGPSLPVNEPAVGASVPPAAPRSQPTPSTAPVRGNSDNSPPQPSVSPVVPSPASGSGERETLLERLRARAKGLGPDALQQILAPRRGSMKS